MPTHTLDSSNPQEVVSFQTLNTIVDSPVKRLRGVKSGFRFFVGTDESPLHPMGPQTVDRI